MPRYRMRHLLAVVGPLVLGLVVLGASPAVNQLMDRVVALEAESAAELMIVDGSGSQVGQFVISSDVAAAVFKFPGLSAFRLRVSEVGFSGSGNLWFESSDCSGTPLMEQSRQTTDRPAAISPPTCSGPQHPGDGAQHLAWIAPPP